MEGIKERIIKVMDDHGNSASQMADRIGVQRSAISHIISGRNKPSLDFILKVLHAFPDVSASWLLQGLESTASSADVADGSSKTITSSGRSIAKVLVLYSDRTVEEFLPSTDH